MTSTAYNLILSLVRSQAFLPRVSEDAIRATVRAYRIGWIVYVSATLLALWLPLLSFAAYLAIALYYLVPRGVDADIEARPSS
jgi:hypothetical protein